MILRMGRKITLIFFLFLLVSLPSSSLYGQTPPVADFIGSPTSGIKPLTVQFTDASTGTVTAWSWDFGDGGLSTEKNPMYIYNSAGTYTVTLTVTGPDGSDIMQKIDYITVSEPPPVADFVGSPTSGIKPLTVQFTDASTGLITGWSWDFGDGGTSIDRNPSHIYSSASAFTVALTVTGPNGSNTQTKTGYITVSEPPPVAGFIASPTSGAMPLTVQFNDSSIGLITSWSWDFGDGGTSTEQNPMYIYNSAGTYTVTLTVTGPGGSDTVTKTNYIIVYAPPVANFTGTPTSGIKPLIVQFTDASAGVITSRLWDFGDGGTSTGLNPSHVYTIAGLYTVSLTVTGPGGSNTKTNTDYIIVNEPPPVADFGANRTSGVRPLTVQFTDKSVNPVTSWFWSFGDGGTSTAQNPYHTYNSIGTYTVTLTVTGPGGADTKTKVDYVRVADIVVDHGSANVSRPQVAADGMGHVYVVWEDNRNGGTDIYFNHSSEYGFTWETQDIRIDTDAPGAGSSNSPQIACDNSGHVYIVWMDDRNGSSDIYFNFSSDYGATWQASDKKLSTAAYAPPAQLPKMACDNSGHVYVAWDDNYFNASADHGQTWLTQAIRISTAGGVNTQTQLLCDENGHVYMVWRTSDVLFNYSLDYGNTWQSSDRRISSSGAIPYGLSLANDENGNIYVAWHDGRNNPSSPDIYFNSSSDYGNTWGSTDLKLNTGTPGSSNCMWPEVSCDQSGNVYVAWYDGRNGLGDIYLNFSTDFGLNWLVQDKRLDTDSAGAADSGYPIIANDEAGDVYVMWTDNQSTIGPGLYMNYSLDHGMSWLSENRKIGVGGIHPQLVTDGVQFYAVRDSGNDILFNEVAPLEVPPFLPADPSPADGANQVGLTPLLSWQCGDANLDDTLTYDIYFGSSSPPQLVSSNLSGTVYTPGTLTYLTTYYWQVVARDNSGAQTVGPIWLFTTMSGPPRFISFDPYNGKTGVGRSDNLIWTAVDDDPGDTLTYDVYFGKTNPPVKQYSNYTCPVSPCNYEPGLLDLATVYYWKIVARDNHGTQTVGPILTFTTINNPPQITSYSPNDGATNVALDLLLKWTASDPDGDTVRYDIYFGTSSPPPLILSNQTVTSYYPGHLTPLTVYYWRIVARDNHGAETALDLSFTTLDHAPQFQSFYSPTNKSTINSLTPSFALSWSAGDLDAGDTITYDIYFGTTSPPPLVLSNQSTTSYLLGELAPFTRYYWQIVARDNHGTETVGPDPFVSVVWFDTSSKPPQFSSFLPGDGATGVDPSMALTWVASDPDPDDTLTYDFYCGMSSPPPLVASNLKTPIYQHATFKPLVVYYWKVVARDNHGDQTVGPILSFTTGNSPPQFLSFSPPDQSTEVILNRKLSWSAVDPDPGDTLKYDVYFGTSFPPPLVVANRTTAAYRPGTLLPLTNYYWKIVARDNRGTETAGPDLMFTTVSPSNIVSVYPNPCQTKMVVSIVGSNFGVTQGSSVVHLDTKVFKLGNAKIVMWSDTKIDLKIPGFLTWPSGTTQTLDLWVTVKKVNSNKVPLTITRP